MDVLDVYRENNLLMLFFKPQEKGFVKYSILKHVQ